MKKVVLVVVSLLLLVSVVPMGVSCSSDDKVEWKVATYGDYNDTRTDILLMFAEKVDELSNGDMEIRVSISGDLFKGEEIFDNVANGNLEMGLIPPVYYFEKMPKYVTLMSQAWGSNVEERIQYYEAVMEEIDAFQQEFTANGVMPFGWVTTGWMEFYFTKEVTELSEIAGMNLVSPGGAVDTLIENVLQATPVYKDVSEVFMAAQTKTIDGVAVMPFDTYYGTSLYTVLPGVKLTRTLDYPFQIMVNSDAWNDLDPELQQVLEDAWDEIQQEGLNLVAERFDAALTDLKANPNVFISEMPAAETAMFLETAIIPIFEGGLKMQFPAEGYSGEAAAAPTAPDSPTVTQIKNIVAGVKAELEGS